METNIMTNSVPHPGEYILEEIQARSWSQRDLSYILGCPEQSINVIISGKRGISPEMAKALGNAFDVPAEFFANLQKSFDLSRARDPDPGVSRRAKLQSIYPVREMIKRGWIEDAKPDMLEAQMARFFQVNSARDIPYIAHAAKKSSYEKKDIPPVQLAWLFRIKQIANSISAPKYSEKALREAISRLQNIMIAPEEISQVPQILKECGVRYVIVEALPHGKIDGVCFWLDKNSPVIGMSIRYDRIDNFWFVLRHEIEHILQKHAQESEIIDDLEGEKATFSDSLPEEERIANQAAAEFCAPKQELDSFIARKNPFFSEKDVLGFARKLQIHPGIIVGQIQFCLNRYDLLKKYLIKIRHHILASANADGWGHITTLNL
jgi:HTH-type transcriptional regulator/antitoxin HigA